MNRSLRYASEGCMPAQMRTLLDAQRAGERFYSKKEAPRQARKDSEHTEQVEFFARIRALAAADARFADAHARTYAIPNGGARSKRTAGRLKAEGVRPGIPDVFLSLPVGGQHGLYIEMKSLTGSPSREQREWLAASIRLGYAAACCRGADQALMVWRRYVEASFE